MDVRFLLGGMKMFYKLTEMIAANSVNILKPAELCILKR